MPDPSTRERLLDAAWQQATEHGVDGLTLAAVGAAAGVTRQAVYLHFGNRATLLVEMAARVDHTSGLRSGLASTRHLPPRDGFRRMLEIWFDYIPSILRVHLALEAASLGGGDGADAYRDRMSDWRAGIHVSIARLADNGDLSPLWDVDKATDWTWACVHPTTFHHLTNERRWTRTETARRIIDTLQRELLSSGDPSR